MGRGSGGLRMEGQWCCARLTDGSAEVSGEGSTDVTGPAKSLLSANCRLASFTVDGCEGCNSHHTLSIQICDGG